MSVATANPVAVETSHDRIHVIIEHLFTPEQARSIYDATIAANANFRHVTTKSAGVAEYSDAMRNGLWEWTHANPIRLNDDWTLCSEGLHRLLACAVTGIPLRSLVLVGSQWDAGINTDRGKTRTLAQFLTHGGYTSTTAKAAILRAHVSRVLAVQRNLTVSYASTTLVHDQMLIDFVKSNHDALHWAAVKTSVAGHRGMNGTGYGVFLFEASQVDHEMAAEFHSDFISDSLDENDPLRRMRAFHSARAEKTNKRLSTTPTINALVRCWDLRLTGDQLKVWKQPGWDDVRFPSGFVVPEASS
jgi:hypothetical protein